MLNVAFAEACFVRSASLLHVLINECIKIHFWMSIFLVCRASVLTRNP